MKKQWYFFLLTLVLSVSVLGFIYNQPTQRPAKEYSWLSSMSPARAKYMLGTSEIDGIVSVAYLNDARKQMSEYGLKQTHHIMVAFDESRTGYLIDTGAVEIMVVEPNGRIVNTAVLSAMDGGFGTDINLSQEGTYHFEIRAALPDGKVRTFRHSFVNMKPELLMS